MKIAIIGTGNIGGTLAKGWAKAGHEIILGVRDVNSEKTQQLLADLPGAKVAAVADATAQATVILVATPAGATEAVAKSLGNVEGKILIDAMNAVRDKPAPYDSTYEALAAWTQADVVKAFNCVGFETMANPHFGDTAVEMYMAGGKPESKNTVRQLALDLGFADCVDVGDATKVPLLEAFAMLWINLAFVQGKGRGFAFKLMER
jgi:hypothetical protein